eukprot:TRINITY_DN41210_c0_g1_i1.p1 TRINITY_DN41210_c0_g1~~TRINITY_DN41210_c0_g1_i1.p1  ORF type:complete len:752 (-),score=125.14 TRINITY_DN41210_c0_g1_i1:18-2225(-)
MCTRIRRCCLLLVACLRGHAQLAPDPDNLDFNAAVLTSVGAIYGVLPSSSRVLKVEPLSDLASLEHASDSSESGGDEWLQLVALSDGSALYAPPYAARRVLRIIPLTQSITTIGPDLGAAPSKWRHSSLAPNGAIYAVPWKASSVLKIDASARVSLLGSFGVSLVGAWGFSVSAGSAIVGIPWGASDVLCIDSSTDDISTFGDFGSEPGKWRYATASSSGVIYALPLAATSVLRIDVSSRSAKQIGSLHGGSYKWASGVQVGQWLFGLPDSACSILQLNMEHASVWTQGDLSCQGVQSHKWRSAVVADNGAIYAVPFTADSVLKIVHSFSGVQVSTFGNFGSLFGKWGHAVSARSGAIYGVPHNAASVLKVTPGTDDVSTFGALGASEAKWKQGVVATNGIIYCIPNAAETILKIDPLTSTATELPIHSKTGMPSSRARWQPSTTAHITPSAWASPASVEDLPQLKLLTTPKPIATTTVQIMCLGFSCPVGSVLRSDAAEAVCRSLPCEGVCCRPTCFTYACPQGYNLRPSAQNLACSQGFCGKDDLPTCCNVDLYHPDLLVPLLIFTSTGLICIVAQTVRCRRERLNYRRKFAITYITVLFAWDVCDQTASWWFWQYTTDVGASWQVQAGSMLSAMLGTVVIFFAFFAGLFMSSKQLLDYRCPEMSYSVAAGCADVLMLISAFMFEMEGRDQGSWIKVLNLLATIIDFVLKVMQAAGALFSPLEEEVNLMGAIE